MDNHTGHEQKTNHNSSEGIYPSPTNNSQPHPSQQHQSSIDNAQHPGKNNAVEIVWQWVTYGLWEWSLIALSVLLSASLSYFFNNSGGSSDYTYIIYILAAMLCLLPLAYVANNIYSKKEPAQKHGFSAVVMVINAVGVFLASIISAIVFVLSILNIFVGTNTAASNNIAISSSFIVMALAAMLFVRIIDSAKLVKFTKLFPKIVVLIAGAAVVLAIAGPFRSSVSSRQDRLIEKDLYDVSSSIQSYTTQKGHLPNSLQDLNNSNYSGAKTLIDKNLVTYKKLNTNTVNVYADPGSSFSGLPQTIYPTSQDKTYQLCVNYKKAKGSGTSSNGVDTIDVYNHPAGKQCYKETAY